MMTGSTLFHSFGVTMLRSVVLAFLLFCTISAHAAEAPWIRVSSSHFSVLTVKHRGFASAPVIFLFSPMPERNEAAK